MSVVSSTLHTHLVGGEAHVSQLEDGGEDGPDGRDLIRLQTHRLEAPQQELEVLLVLLALQFTGTALEEDGGDN